MSRKYPFFGYRKITQKLRDEGWSVGKKLVQRVRREEHLQVPAPKPRRRRQGLSTGLPTEALRRNHVWSWDFMSDYTQRGGKLRVFNLIDEYTRECHCIHSDRAIKAEDVLTLLQGAIAKQLNSGSGSVRPTASLRQNLKKQTKHNNPTGNLS